MASYPRDWSLSTVVDDFLGPLPVHVTRSATQKGLANWYRFNVLLAARHSSTDTMLQLERARAAGDLWTRMTAWHRHAFRLLYEWWTASYQDPATSLAGIFDIVDECDRVDEEGATSQEAWRRVLKILELKRWPVGDIKSHNNGRVMHYDERILELFRWEFDSTVEDPIMDASLVHPQRRNRRSQAALYAYCQQLSWHCFYDLEPVAGCNESCKEKQVNAVERLWDNENPFTSVAARGPIIEACPWLEKTENDLGTSLPYYLWDVENSRTVETSQLKLDSSPEYTAVSHTWGRWTTGEPLPVDGVPWKVPQNTKFRVQDLATLLRGIPRNAPYVWLDLVCIPQDGSLLGIKEIARQAKIFNAAHHVVAWFNEVDDFDGLQSILRWQALHLLHVQDHDDKSRRAARIEQAWGDIAWKPSGLLKPRSGKLDWASLVLNPWYTSLWTLQEVALRPDIWMCTKDWRFLTLDNGTTPVPFSGFVAIFEIFWQNHRDKVNHPYSPRAEDQSHIALFELGFWRFETGLSKILGLDRVTILTLGDRRECSRRRGEAIMSALGITTWYDEALARVERDHGSQKDFHAEIEQNLVLQKYPISFVRELMEKVPGDFFGAFLRLNIDTQGKDVLAHHAGSLLPFSGTKAFYAPAGGFRIANYQVPTHTHPSVKSWQVLATGMVHIPEACVVYSTMDKTGSDEERILPVRMGTPDVEFGPRRVEIVAPLPRGFTSIHDRGMDFSTEGWLDFNSWIKSQQEETYALLVQYQLSIIGLAVQGIIVKRQVSGMLWKTDWFFAMDENGVIDLSRTQNVSLTVD